VGTAFRFVPIGTRSGNVAVTGLTSRLGDGDIALQAGIRNSGAEPASGWLQLLAEGRLVGAQEWTLEAGEERYLTWSHLPAGPAWYEARLSGVLPEVNALEQDDRAWAAVAAPSEARALLVTPGNSFLERVLSVHGGLRAFKASPADWPGLVAQGNGYPLTVLDRFRPEDLPAGNILLVGAGGGEEFRPREVWPRENHPLLSHVDWSEVRVGAARSLQLDSGWETLIDSDGGPLLAIRSEGARREAALAFDLSQSDLALRPAFPVLMANLLDWLLPRPEEAPRIASPGAAVSIEPAPLAQQLWVEAPDGTRHEVAPPWPPMPFRPSEPGLYAIVQEWPEGQQESLLVAGGYHAEEADLAPRSVELAASGDAPTAPARGALSLWPLLAGAILLVSMLEWWVDARGR
jgi:Ca-activated chloride channel homolog